MAFFDALVPLLLNDTGAGAAPMVDHVYTSAPSPSTSAPSTDSAVVLPVTGFVTAEAAVAIVGAWLLEPALEVTSMKLILLFTPLGAALIVSRPSVTVMDAVLSKNRFAALGVPVTTVVASARIACTLSVNAGSPATI